MNDFVERCRREWRRLGVADDDAEEMAADLASDLAEAAAEGVSTEELLGSSADDPRAFAASWASSRGLLPEPAGRARGRRTPRFLLAFTVVAAITLVVAALLLATGQPRVSLVASRAAAPHLSPPAGSVLPPPPGPARSVVSASAATPIEWILLGLAIVALAFATWLWSSWARSRPPAAPA